MSMRVMHFEIQAADVQKAIAFYQRLFGWQFTRWGEVDYWLITTGPEDQPGINGGLLPRRGPEPADGQSVNAYVCTAHVPSLDEALARLAEAGGSVAHPKMPIPGVGWLAYGKDGQGNIFGMMQPDPKAA
jgi:predicted enzyme related to lactoylglutathione lyase